MYSYVYTVLHTIFMPKTTLIISSLIVKKWVHPCIEGCELMKYDITWLHVAGVGVLEGLT